MSELDIVSFILMILVLGSLSYLLYRMDVSAKKKYKMTAYDLLDKKNPDPKKIKDSIRLLRLYGGRFRKDPECSQLIGLLVNLLDEIEKTSVAPDRKVR